MRAILFISDIVSIRKREEVGPNFYIYTQFVLRNSNLRVEQRFEFNIPEQKNFASLVLASKSNISFIGLYILNQFSEENFS